MLCVEDFPALPLIFLGLFGNTLDLPPPAPRRFFSFVVLSFQSFLYRFSRCACCFHTAIMPSRFGRASYPSPNETDLPCRVGAHLRPGRRADFVVPVSRSGVAHDLPLFSAKQILSCLTLPRGVGSYPIPQHFPAAGPGRILEDSNHCGLFVLALAGRLGWSYFRFDREEAPKADIYRPSPNRRCRDWSRHLRAWGRMPLLRSSCN